jgi:ribosome-associated toxin RatA of RatAB toxin-antitoxin module
MATTKVSIFSALKGITSFEKLKEFEATVMKMNINYDLRNRLLRQATENFCLACPMV